MNQEVVLQNHQPPSVGGRLCTPAEVAAAIERGAILWVAGDERLLEQLPRGRWIGGSIPYFMCSNGGETSRDRIYCSEMPPEQSDGIEITLYDTGSMHRIARDAPDNGFTILLIPAFTRLHLDYAQNAPGYEEMFLKPIAGWITGVHLDELDQSRPCVFDGETGERSYDKAVAMHVALRPGKIATVGIVNTFTQGQGDEIQFPETGFSVTRCTVNGQERSFAEYVLEQRLDERLPLVANYSGTMVNVSIQKVDAEQGTVSFYAPVFSGIKYRQAAPIGDFVQAFQSALPKFQHGVTFSCNCVLNYLYSALAGKKTADMTGPMTFGEIAYQLLNQTLVYVVIEDI